MRVRDLTTSTLNVSLRTTPDAELLDRAISGCAQSELMDPSPYLQAGELVLTTGMALHFEDPRTWEAYVERLASVSISALAFSVGRIHPTVPTGLIAACEKHGVPLFELPASLPLLQFSRHIWQELAAQRYEIVRAGWNLADDCTRMATDGVPIVRVLQRVADAVDAHVTLLDPDGHVLASAGVPVTRPGAPSSLLTLPGGSGARFALRVRGGAEGLLLQPLLGPVAAVIAMQLSYTLASRSPLHAPAAADFARALLDDNTPLATIAERAAEARFVPTTPFHVLTVTTGPTGSAAGARLLAWRLRVHLESHFAVVRFFEQPQRTLFILQGPHARTTLLDALEGQIETRTVAAVWASHLSLDELPLAVRMAVRQRFVPGIRSLPPLDLATIARALPSTGLDSLARRVIGPLEEADPTGTLTETLRSYLRHSGATRTVGDELFIHRNTLAYRIRRIESVLGVDLQDGEARATLLLALRIVEG